MQNGVAPSQAGATPFFRKLQADDASKRREMDRRIGVIAKALVLLGKLKRLIDSQPMRTTKSAAVHASILRKQAIAYLLDSQSLEQMILELGAAITECEEELEEDEIEYAHDIYMAAAFLSPNILLEDRVDARLVVVL